MVFFKNADMQRVIETKVKNDYGKLETIYKLDKKVYRVCLQPISAKEKIYTWGSSIKANKQVFCDEILNTSDLVCIDSKTYKVEDSLYECYALIESDVKINA